MSETLLPRVLILTPIKDAADLADVYRENVSKLSYPKDLLSLGFLESDSRDGTEAAFRCAAHQLSEALRRVTFVKKDFQFTLADGMPRWEKSIQSQRRAILAKSRNHLLFHALDDEDWVLWLDVDVIEYPADLIQRLLAAEKDIVQPNCVLEYGGKSFDLNAWRDHGALYLDALRSEGQLVPLDAVGGTALLIKADLHRDGLVFPPYFYGERNARARQDKPYIETSLFGEIETEGLGIMANDMGLECYGLPNLEVLHRRK